MYPQYYSSQFLFLPMCGFEVVEQREYVPHPLPALLVGVLVIGIGIGLNIYLTGEMFRYTGHGYGLLVLGIFTVFAAAGSVTIDTQWIFSAEIGRAHV